ncbi:MAG: PAS domain S-box protein, partial [Candidatus Cloacimonetes bacterium]|nr:PAS domain S-box protein [Candidatus Cloacimonadota bacterium]
MTEKATYEELEQTESDLKKSKNALQETEQFLVSIFESIQDGISILNTDCSIRYVNDVMKKWYSEKLPLEGKKCFEAYHDANKPCDHCPTLRCLESGKTEIDIVSGLSGSDVEWIELYSYPIYHAETGKITGIIEFARDITQQKRVETSLLESEERFKTLSTLTFEGILTHHNGVIIDSNRAATKILGYTREELIGENIIQLCVPQEYHATIKENIVKSCAKPYEVMARRKDGTLFPVEIEAKDIKKNNKIFRVAAIRDITERRQAAEILRESEEKYRQLFELESDAIFLIEKETGKILEVNTSATKIYGFSREELLTMKNIDLSAEPEKTKEATRDQLNQIPIRYHRKKDGSVFPVEITASHLNWQGRESHIAAIRDISFRVKTEMERDRLEKELYQARKMDSLGTLTGGIAHDFNNLLYMIVGNTELALEDVPKWNPVHSNLEEIKSASLRAAGIVKQLLNFSRKTDQEMKPIGAITVIKDALKFMRSTIP